MAATNLFTNPAPGSSAGFSSAGSAVIGYNTSERSVTVLTNGASQSGVNVRAAGVGEVGVPYSAGVWVKAPAGEQMYAHLRVLGSVVDSVTSSFEGTGGWSWVALEGAEAPAAGSSFTELSVRSASAGAAFQFEVRRLILEVGATSSGYFDGSMRGYYWAGEPDNSVSIKAPRPNPDHRRRMYFGVPGAMSWVPCPQVERPSGLSQWQEEVPLLNGGLHVRRSFGGHREFEMSWTGISAEDAQLLEAYASGVYGDGLIYWLDPMMADKNVLPIWWSAPALGGLGAPSLGAGGSKPILGDPVSYPSGSSVPRQSALFDFRAGRGRRLWLPVPEDYSLWIYHHARLTGNAGLWVSQSLNGGDLDWRPWEVPSEPLGGRTPEFHEYSPQDPVNADGVQIVYRTDGEPWAGTVNVTDMGAQILPRGHKPEQETPYVAGMGAAGCVVTEFDKTDMSAAFNKVNVTMVLKEVGPWR